MSGSQVLLSRRYPIAAIMLAACISGSAFAQTTLTLGPADSVGRHMSPSGLGLIGINIGGNAPYPNDPTDCSFFELNGSITGLDVFVGTTTRATCGAISDTGAAAVTVQSSTGGLGGSLSTATSRVNIPIAFGSSGDQATDVSSDGQVIVGILDDPFFIGFTGVFLSSNPATLVASSVGQNSLGNLITLLGTRVSDNGEYFTGFVNLQTPGIDGPYRNVVSTGGYEPLTPPPDGTPPSCAGDPDIANDGSVFVACRTANPLNPAQTNVRIPVIYEFGSSTASAVALPSCASVSIGDFSRTEISGDRSYARARGNCGGSIRDFVWFAEMTISVPFEDYLTQIGGFTFPTGVTLTSLDGFSSSFDRFTVTVDDNGTKKAGIISLPEPSIGVALSAGGFWLAAVSGVRERRPV